MNPADAARMGLGIACVAVPGQMLESLDLEHGPGTRRTVQVLGARYLAHSTLNLTVPGPGMRRASQAIDVVHALSMLGLAAASRRHRRVALTSAGLATGFVLADHAVRHVAADRQAG